MAKAPDPTDYDALVYTLLHEAMDRLIELGSIINAHSDILNEEIEEGSAEQLLRAQMGLENGEEEAELTQHLIQVTSNILIQRRARDIVIEDGLDRALNMPEEVTAHPEQQ